MRMRERSSVERMRMALTEKRDILGDIGAVERVSSVKTSGVEKRGRKERRREGRRGEEKDLRGSVMVFQQKSTKLAMFRIVREDTLAIELVTCFYRVTSVLVSTPDHHEIILHQLLN